MMEFLKALIIASEKAANIARTCRRDEHLFELLVQKKEADEANPRFVEDFKTLADVLIQEMVKHDIGKQFRQLSDNIKGEENNVFVNKLGEKISVEIKPSEEQTCVLLEKVLNGDHIAATLLAAEAHRELGIEDVKTNVSVEQFNVNLEELGIWIDPIDCTAEYIKGNRGDCYQNIQLRGLECVTILIGVFNRRTGVPVVGVMNTPFFKEDFNHCVWGVSLLNTSLNSITSYTERKNVICVSSSEKDEIKEKLKAKGFYVVEPCGAGYKILTVILGLADAYVLTKGTTFKWDTCAPHAILNSLGGDIVEYDAVIGGDLKRLVYSGDNNSCNVNGIIAYRTKEILNDIVDAINSY